MLKYIYLLIFFNENELKKYTIKPNILYILSFVRKKMTGKPEMKGRNNNI